MGNVLRVPPSYAGRLRRSADVLGPLLPPPKAARADALVNGMLRTGQISEEDLEELLTLLRSLQRAEEERRAAGGEDLPEQASDREPSGAVQRQNEAPERAARAQLMAEEAARMEQVARHVQRMNRERGPGIARPMKR